MFYTSIFEYVYLNQIPRLYQKNLQGRFPALGHFYNNTFQ